MAASVFSVPVLHGGKDSGPGFVQGWDPNFIGPHIRFSAWVMILSTSFLCALGQLRYGESRWFFRICRSTCLRD